MGIINVTPDSFYSGSRVGNETDLRDRVLRMVKEGATMIDVGAYSTRPDAAEVSPEEELRRLEWALPIIIQTVHDARCRRCQIAKDPSLADKWGANPCEGCLVDSMPFPISVDTFRASVAEAAVTRLGADIINDVSGGTLDPEMIPLVNRLHVPYILMHMRGTPQTMQQLTVYPEGVTTEVIRFFRQQLSLIDGAQVILDPGFGFAKTLEQNYELMRDLPQVMAAFPEHPMLVGISRKSMIYRLLGTQPAESLNGTTVLNTLAIGMGADILRVHDVRECVEAVRIVQLTK